MTAQGSRLSVQGALKARGSRLRAGPERGVALMVVLLVMTLLAALGLSLSLVTSTESRIAVAYGEAIEVFYAADALLERAILDVTAEPDWNAILAGSARSSFTDGPVGPRTLADGTTLDLQGETAGLDASSQALPWGANNPVWRVYAHGPLSALGTRINSLVYVVVWVADDSSENDGMPLRDGVEAGGPNPGRGRLEMRVHAYGLVGARRILEATIARDGLRTRVLSWREVR